MTRVTSEFWVSALTRRVFSAGGYAAVLRRGAAEAGAIFLVLRARDGTVMLAGPSPQADYDSARPGMRRFTVVAEGLGEEELAARLEKEGRFDPDFWVLECEFDASVLRDWLEIE